MKRISSCLCGVLLLFLSLPAGAKEGIVNTRHNLSVTGPGELRALPGADPLNRVCIFCHTPHNAAPRTPLWNRSVAPVSYVPYSSTTLGATPSQPDGPSRLCLSCHDGTIALGALLMPAGGMATTGQIAPGRTSYLGVVLSDDHPFSFPYYASVANPLAGLSPALPEGLAFYSNGFMHCSTCHDAHEDAYRSEDKEGRLTGKFLAADNRHSGLCVKCHSLVGGWSAGTHNTTQTLQPVGGVLPVAPRNWPTWKTVAEWGCECCHTSHSAGGQQRLLYFQEEEKSCYLCHDGSVAGKNIRGQFQKASAHPVETNAGLHDPAERPALITNRHVECADCHNPHAANGNTAAPPSVSGKLDMVSGVNADRAGVYPAANEYEICFKCHADWTPRYPFILRVVNSANTRLEFSLSNPSYHPVIGIGRNSDVPSIPSPDRPLLTASSIIYCTDCHGDDGPVTRGPHGSPYPPILRDRYETADGTPESPAAYALCYACHNRNIILFDVSFQKSIATGRGGHSGHLARGATCSACHDPHGVVDDGLSGSHAHLVNFDTNIVLPVGAASPANKPVFNDTGRFAGSCTLVCHGVVHNNLAYP